MRGQASLNGQRLAEGDGAAVRDEPELTISGDGPGGEVLLFDLP